MEEPGSEPSACAAVVYNPVKVDVAQVRSAVGTAATHAGWREVLWFETTVDEEGQSQTREALAKGVTLVVAAGGDGTVRAVAEALNGTNASLGILPSGTGNLLARNLNLPLTDLDEACTIAFAGADRPIDIGIAALSRADGENTEHAFLVMAGLGIDAAMMAKTRPTLKRRFGWLAYVDAGFRALPETSKVRIGYSLDDDEKRTAHVSTILVANCGTLPGAIELIPDAILDDGKLDIAVLQPKSWLGWLFIWRRVTWENRVLRRTSLGRSIIRLTDRGRLGRRTELTYLRSASVRLSVESPEPFELDGDEVGDVLGIDFTVGHRALIVRVPRRDAAA
ncbi:diacylglycerol/lipid kinase family protein [Diaminobutyricibacter sp. McL0608]|uniref:diacylglycerol/lipid kinase family protein n=1 Tax=Leifsonia sp. McL0608 TaxID=3143537 RepID=UPI0031F316A5